MKQGENASTKGEYLRAIENIQRYAYENDSHYEEQPTPFEQRSGAVQGSGEDVPCAGINNLPAL